jgi:hypothetical protein
MKEEWNISICGLNCSKCDIYLAYRGDRTLLKEMVDYFKDEKNEIINPESIACDGCRGSNDVHWSSDCKMRTCALSKNHNYCFECPDFPCSIIDDFKLDGVPHHKRTVENSKKMKEIGLENWMKEQILKEKCEFCP